MVRREISLEQKLAILKQFRSGQIAADIARVNKLTINTVRTICYRDAHKIEKRAREIQYLLPKEVKQNSLKPTKSTSSRDADKEEAFTIQIVPSSISSNVSTRVVDDVRNDIKSLQSKESKSHDREGKSLNKTAIQNKTESIFNKKSNVITNEQLYVKGTHSLNVVPTKQIWTSKSKSKRASIRTNIVKKHLKDNGKQSVAKETELKVKIRRTQIFEDQSLEVRKRFQCREMLSAIDSILNISTATVKAIGYSDPYRIQQRTESQKPKKAIENSNVIKNEHYHLLGTEKENLRINSQPQGGNSNDVIWGFETMVEVPWKNLRQLEARSAGVVDFCNATPHESYTTMAQTPIDNSAAPMNRFEASRETYLNLDKIVLKEELEDTEHLTEQFSKNVDTTEPKEKQVPEGRSEVKDIDIVHVAEAVKLISKAVDILTAKDPDKDRISEFIKSMANGIKCYKEIYSKQNMYRNTSNPESRNNI